MSEPLGFDSNINKERTQLSVEFRCRKWKGVYNVVKLLHSRPPQTTLLNLWLCFAFRSGAELVKTSGRILIRPELTSHDDLSFFATLSFSRQRQATPARWSHQTNQLRMTLNSTRRSLSTTCSETWRGNLQNRSIISDEIFGFVSLETSFMSRMSTHSCSTSMMTYDYDGCWSQDSIENQLKWATASQWQSPCNTHTNNPIHSYLQMEFAKCNSHSLSHIIRVASSSFPLFFHFIVAENTLNRERTRSWTYARCILQGPPSTRTSAVESEQNHQHDQHALCSAVFLGEANRGKGKKKKSSGALRCTPPRDTRRGLGYVPTQARREKRHRGFVWIRGTEKHEASGIFASRTLYFT